VFVALFIATRTAVGGITTIATVKSRSHGWGKLAYAQTFLINQVCSPATDLNPFRWRARRRKSPARRF